MVFLTILCGFVCVCVCEQYGSFTLAEDTPVGHTVLNISATDADDPDSGSSFIEFHISAGNEDDFFSVETDGKGKGHVVIAKVKYICSLRLQAQSLQFGIIGLPCGSAEFVCFV